MSDTPRPYFSIVIPTRDRPQVMGYCLQSVLDQTFTDFEVIVCDNSLDRPCADVVARFDDKRVRYIVPEKPLGMPDNWEFAVEHARGRFVGVVIDKTVLLPNALQYCFDVLQRTPADIVSWWSEGFTPKDESVSLDEGTYVSAFAAAPPKAFYTNAELVRRFSLRMSRSHEGSHYFFGKICFGFYSSELLDRIRASAGRIFFPISPDYTSMISALFHAERAIDLGRPLQLSFHLSISNGRNTQINPAAALNYLRSVDPSLDALSQLPVPKLYASTHNLVAFDYVSMQALAPQSHPLRHLKLSDCNLILRVLEDLRGIRWPSDDLRHAEYNHVLRFWRGLPFPTQLRCLAAVARDGVSRLLSYFQELMRFVFIEIAGRTLRLFPPLKRLIKRRLPPPSVRVRSASSILDAARICEALYSKPPRVSEPQGSI